MMFVSQPNGYHFWSRTSSLSFRVTCIHSYYIWIDVSHSYLFCVVFFSCSFGHCIVCPSSICSLEFIPGFQWVRVIRYLGLCAMVCRSLFVLFLLVIVVSVFLRYTDYDYPFATIGTGTAYPSGAPVLIRFLVVFVLLDLQFYMYVLQIVACPFVLFPLSIVLSVLLRYTDSDYPFGIFKLFFDYPTCLLLAKKIFFTNIIVGGLVRTIYDLHLCINCLIRC